MGRVVLAVCLSVGSLAAQKVLLADDRERQAGVFRVRDLVGDFSDENAAEPAAGRLRRMRPAGAKEIASLLAGSSLRPGDHVEAVGPDHVVALGQADWIGSVESMLVRMRGGGQRQYQVDTRFCRVTEAVVTKLDRGHLRGVVDAATEANGASFVLDRAAVTEVLRTIRGGEQSQVVQAPQVTAFELDRVRIKVGKSIMVHSAAEAPPADQDAAPTDETIWCGDDATLVVATTNKTTIALSADVASQRVNLPVVVSPGGGADGASRPHVVVPVVRSCRAAASHQVPDGATLVLAARGNDGDWMVTLVTVEEIWSAGVPARRR